jgi:hypothetical protein
MSLTSAEIQQALRISKAIEAHLENTRSVNVRSEDLYSILADLKLVERDLQQGHHFRLFLKKLVKENMLNLIPQCHAMAKSGGKFDFTFNRAGDRMPARKQGAAPVAPVAAEAEATTAPTEEAASGDVTAMADAQQEA